MPARQHRSLLPSLATSIFLHRYLSAQRRSGLPQGSPLSPALFLLSIAALLRRTTTATTAMPASLGWIDDVNVIAWGKLVEEAAANLQVVVPEMEDWARQCSATFEAEQTTLTLFAPPNKVLPHPLPTVTLNNTPLPYSPSLTMLGIEFDASLSYSAHRTACAAKASTALAGVALLAHSKAGLPPRRVKELVKALVMPSLLWCCAVWWKPGGEVSKVVEAVQREAARVVTGGFRTTSLTVLEVEANLLPLPLRLNHHLFRLALHLHSSTPSHPLHERFILAHLAPAHSHQSAINCAMHSFPALLPPSTIIEPIHPDPVAPWARPPPVAIEMAESKEAGQLTHEAMEEALRDAEGAQVVVYSDGSLKEGMAGLGVTMRLWGEGEELGEVKRRRGLGDFQTVAANTLPPFPNSAPQPMRDLPLVGLEAYSDSDWGACVDTARSTMGYTFLLASGAVAWSSKLQPRVAASSTEAEYLGLSHASKEAIFLSQLLGELGVGAPGPATLFGDNQGANALSRDPQFHDRTRHLRLTEHFVREMVQQGVVSVEYIPTAHMVANAMTKSLPLPAFLTHRAGMGVKALRARGAVVSHPFDPSPTPGQHLRLLIRHALLNLHRAFPTAALVVQWVPGHVGVAGNERADDLANAASNEAKAEEDALAKRAVPQAKRRRGGGFFRREMMFEEEGEETDGDCTLDGDYGGDHHHSTPARVALDARQRPNLSLRAYTTVPSPSSPDVVPDGDLLPKSVSALQQAHRAALLAEWAHRWRTSTTGASLRRVDPRPPGPAFSRLLSSLPRRHAVLLTRVRTNFVDLGARRFWLAAGDKGRMCERCRKEETREHVVLECEAYKEARGELRREPAPS
ncbi:hypothetical protein JCM6882_006580 [Rhodosporidiobolus microsporus]